MGLYRYFFDGLLADPRGVSALTPSSGPLAAAIARKVNPFIPGLVIELGAGTGAITAALLARGISPERLVALESSPRFCALLRHRFPGIRVVCGDALNCEHYIESDEKIAAVVSGLPLLNFAPVARRALIAKALDLQGPHGRFVQLSYGFRPAIAAAEGFAITKNVVWRNLPPAHIWTYMRTAQAAPVRLLKNPNPQLAV